MELYGFRQGVINRPLSTILPGSEEGLRVDITYHFWCLKHAGRTILIDTGLNEHARSHRNLQQTATQAECLKAIGLSPEDVDEVIVTHLHSDHCSDASIYPNAIFHVQQRDLTFFSSPAVRFHYLRRAACDMKEVMDLLYAGRLRVIDGDCTLYDRLRLKLVGGHTPGQMVVVLDDADHRPTAVVCSDAVDLRDNLRKMAPPALVFNTFEALEGLEFVQSLNLEEKFVLCGHDPKTSASFERINDGPAFRVL